MEQFEKKFTVQGTDAEYEVRFDSDGQTVNAHCTCPAGEHKTLCRHILKCIDDDSDLRFALTQCGYLQVYEEHLARLRYAESVKREAKNLKRKFERLLLGR